MRYRYQHRSEWRLFPAITSHHSVLVLILKKTSLHPSVPYTYHTFGTCLIHMLRSQHINSSSRFHHNFLIPIFFIIYPIHIRVPVIMIIYLLFLNKYYLAWLYVVRTRSQIILINFVIS